MRAQLPVTDDQLVAKFHALGCSGTPEKALSDPCLRGALTLAVRAEMQPNPHARAYAPTRSHARRADAPVGPGVDAKRRAANDIDKE